MAFPHSSDPYRLDKNAILESPSRFRQKLKFLGPGFILSASVVGSGELIATTSLGAKAGFVTLWVILVSCLVKIVLQLEFGRQSITRGVTAMNMMNKIPGPRFGKRKVSWAVWSWLVLWLFKPLQLGGIIGGVAIILNIAVPALSIAVWTILVAFIVITVMLFGFYEVVEKISLVFMVLFTVFTLLALFMVQNTGFAVTWPDIAEGLSFRLPKGTVGFAFAAFGLTGVGGDEILSYNYWCIEKGYARYTGSREESDQWKKRARGWIRVMYLDAFLSMIVYTVVTAAFFLLGASILYQRGDIPEGYQMIETLSRIYTESVGPTAKNIFLAGSFVVLFSTLFAALAIRTRVFSDLFGVVGWIDFNNLRTRLRTIRFLAIMFPVLWTIAFLVIRLPVLMVTIGGIATFVMLFIVVIAGIWFRFGPEKGLLSTGRLYNFFLIISCLAIFSVAIYGILKLF
ncbi:MAG: Nramp family divalent metal transporter [Bacteroidales bacterium]|nr:Nramp family divalent metal transporter [Bacteroidales bacterium]